MIGVQAIGGGFFTLLVLSTVGLFSIAGVVLGGALFWKKKRAVGAALVALAAIALFTICNVVIRTLPTALDHLALNLNETADSVRAVTKNGCTTVQEWCQVAGRIKKLSLLLPGEKRSELSAGSVNVRFVNSTVREVLVHSSSTYSASELLSLLAAERANSVQATNTSSDKFAQAVASNALVRSDQSAVFVHDRYVVVVTSLPRNSPEENYRVMYRVSLAENLGN